MIRKHHVLSTLLLLAACGGGGGGGDVAGGGTGGSGISSGPINGFGSIFVAGTKWDTDSAAVSIDGEPFTENQLKLGMRTTVRGTKSADGSTGTAATITVDNSVKGPIAEMPTTLPDGSVSFEVLGLSLVADGHTAFSPGFSLEMLSTAAGQWVQVSGLLGVDGAIRATRVEDIAPSPQHVEVEGLVSGVDDLDGYFEVGNLTVFRKGPGVAGCEGLSDLPEEEISVGIAVEVTGVFLSDTEICADSVEIEDDFGEEDDFEIQGVVTEVTNPTRFSLSGIAVITNDSTEYEPAGLRGAIEPGMELEVEGHLADGLLTASKVEQEASVEIEAVVEDVADNGLEFVVLGLPIHVFPNGGTKLKDGFPTRGDYVEVEAVDDGAGGLTAIEVEVESGEVDRARIESRVDRVGEFSAEGIGNFSIHGVEVTVGAGTDCEGSDGVTISCGDFFAQLKVGDLVKATDRSPPYDFVHAAKEVAFED